METNDKEDDNEKPNHSTRGTKNSFGDGKSVREKRAKSSPKKLSTHQWGELFGLLRSGFHTQTELAEMYGVSVGTISTKKRRIEIESGQVIAPAPSSVKTLEKIDKTANALVKAVNFSVEETGEIITKARRNTLDRQRALAAMAQTILKKAYTDGNLASVKDDAKVILDFQTFFKNDLAIIGSCLGFKDGDYSMASDSTVLTILKMTEEEEDRQKNKLSDDDVVDDSLFDDSEIE